MGSYKNICFMEKGYVLINQDDQYCVIVTTVREAAKVIGVDRRTVTRWMQEQRMWTTNNGWIIVKGYNFIKRKPKGINDKKESTEN